MTLHTPTPNPSPFVRFTRRIYHPLHFQKGYNFTLWFIFSAALLGFLLARAQYMNVSASYLPQAGPGEAYYFRQYYYRIGISIHLIAIIPAGFLVLFQFTPYIRHTFRLFHRINGSIIILLLLVSNVGALLIVRRAFGGTLATQSATGVLALATTLGSVLAYINIKSLQIDQHRAWMIRTWFYAGSIITTRLIMIIAVQIISSIGSYYTAMSCAQIAGTRDDGDVSAYAACVSDPGGYTAVHADFSSTAGIEEIAAGFELTFGMALWMAIVIHAVGVEVYLRLTTAEGERLREVSYERQVEKGMKRPGRAGLTADRLGDVEVWVSRGKGEVGEGGMKEGK
ncbi:unnamed protein product [Zymoseptoria tritici ST99CH_1E4]|uniref:Uncharacterized protein n=1 Tax=Zymoseptoria tritici ST99CH_1E4 TaxID=1276532 RepID=A0A2H1GXF5_ZYMTR|nr:unnamed protein product [Zymoseptoria tritici ST99CH_1E4]